jgi:hypothetical protein
VWFPEAGRGQRGGVGDAAVSGTHFLARDQQDARRFAHNPEVAGVPVASDRKVIEGQSRSLADTRCRRMGALLIGDSPARFGAPFGHLRHRAVHPQNGLARDGPPARGSEHSAAWGQKDRVRDPAIWGTPV